MASMVVTLWIVAFCAVAAIVFCCMLRIVRCRVEQIVKYPIHVNVTSWFDVLEMSV